MPRPMRIITIIGQRRRRDHRRVAQRVQEQFHAVVGLAADGTMHGIGPALFLLLDVVGLRRRELLEELFGARGRFPSDSFSGLGFPGRKQRATHGARAAGRAGGGARTARAQRAVAASAAAWSGAGRPGGAPGPSTPPWLRSAAARSR